MTTNEVLIVVAFKDFQDKELIVCKRILEEQKKKVIVASKFLGMASGMLGNKIMVDVILPQVKIENYDALIFIGGQGAVDYIDDHICHQIIQTAFNRKKVIAAICIAPAILAQAGILQNKKATVWASELNRKMLKIFKKQKVDYQEQDVVVDKENRIVTANGPAAVEQFTQAILELLQQVVEDELIGNDLNANKKKQSGRFIGRIGIKY
jgi:protease I